MTIPRSRAVVSILAALIAASFSSAAAQEFDHLECYQVKDPLRLRGPKPSWLDLSRAVGATEQCRIVGGFRLYCVPVRKEVTASIERKLDGRYEPFVPLPFDGVSEQSRICYRIRCVDAEPPEGVVSDQFGTRSVEKAKPFLLCGPAVEGACDAVCAGVCTDAQTDPDNCGVCGNACSANHASPACVGGACEFTCDVGFADCNAVPSDGCEADLGTLTNCGSCGNSCSNPNGSASCVAGACASVCASGFGDCDGNSSNGCETNLQTAVGHCGTCGNSCPDDAGTALCVSGACQVSSCSPGFGDCNGDPSDGCETDLGTLANCGACDTPCTVPNGTASCATGACAVGACDPGFDDCNGDPSDGCETDLEGTPGSCGICGNTCAAGEFCSMGVCVFLP